MVIQKRSFLRLKTIRPTPSLAQTELLEKFRNQLTVHFLPTKVEQKEWQYLIIPFIKVFKIKMY